MHITALNRPLRITRVPLFILLVLAVVGPSVFGNSVVQAQPGQLTGFSFLRMEPSARAAALGGAFNAVQGDDVNAFFYNPALANAQMHRGLSVSF